VGKLFCLVAYWQKKELWASNVFFQFLYSYNRAFSSGLRDEEERSRFVYSAGERKLSCVCVWMKKCAEGENACYFVANWQFLALGSLPWGAKKTPSSVISDVEEENCDCESLPYHIRVWGSSERPLIWDYRSVLWMPKWYIRSRFAALGYRLKEFWVYLGALISPRDRPIYCIECCVPLGDLSKGTPANRAICKVVKYIAGYSSKSNRLKRWVTRKPLRLR